MTDPAGLAQECLERAADLEAMAAFRQPPERQEFLAMAGQWREFADRAMQGLPVDLSELRSVGSKASGAGSF